MKTKATKMSLDLITLTDGDLDEIGDKVWDTITKLLQQLEQQPKQALSTIQKDLCKLQIQTTKIQAGEGQSSATSTSLALGTTHVVEMVQSLDLWVVTLPDGALSMEAAANSHLLKEYWPKLVHASQRVSSHNASKCDSKS